MVTFRGTPALAVVGRAFPSLSVDGLSWSRLCNSGWWKYPQPECLHGLRLSHWRTERFVEKQLKQRRRRIQNLRRSPIESNSKSSQSDNLCSFSQLKMVFRVIGKRFFLFTFHLYWTLVCPSLASLIGRFGRSRINLVGWNAEGVMIRGCARTQPHSEGVLTSIFYLSSSLFIPGKSIR